MKKCNKCLTDKELKEFYKNSQSRDGHRPICKQCEEEKRKLKISENKYEHRLKVMASAILKRLKYCQWEGYDHLKCYKDNNVQNLLGESSEEIAKNLHSHFFVEINNLIREDKVPSVDRIDSKGNYELSNIRIIDAIENGKDGFKNANEARKKRVLAIYSDGSQKEFESLSDAGKYTNLHSRNVARLIENNGISRKERIKFKYL